MKLALLLGDPVGHSLSPLIHNAAFREAGIDARYIASRVPAVTLEAALEGLRSPDTLGANITIPHKEAVARVLDRLSSTARVIGAVNTIVREDNGALVGHNTDAFGFLKPLRAIALPNREAVVLGSGGAARAVVYALLTALEIDRITIAARRPERGLVLSDELLERTGSDRSVSVIDLDDSGSAIRGAGLVVNTTPVGMYPEEEETPWDSAQDFQAGQVIYDLVYNPLTTRLLRDAAYRGAAVIGGLEMLVGQAAMAFELWTGHPFPESAVREALTSHLSTASR